MWHYGSLRCVRREHGRLWAVASSELAPAHTRLLYKHGFHAGNAADVLKHCVLICLLQQMTAKNKPFSYVDTHAGAGSYNLLGDEATTLGEHKAGLGILRSAVEQGQELPASAAELLQISNGLDGAYPGSPCIAARLCRPMDSLLLVERAVDQHASLVDAVGADERVTAHLADGYAVVRNRKLCPAGGKRALVLIDPPYQFGSDNDQIATVVEYCTKHWRAARLAIWFPLTRDASKVDRLYKAVCKAAGDSDVLTVELQTRGNAETSVSGSGRAADGGGGDVDVGGMLGSGMLLVQPPFGIDAQLNELLPALDSLLTEGASVSPTLPRVSWLRRS